MASQSLCLSAQPKSFHLLDKIQGDFCNHEIIARLVHFWEARNFKKGNTLMGFQILLMDSESNVVQGFIPSNRLFRHQDNLKANSVNKFNKFLVNPCKRLYKVADHNKSIFFTDQTTMIEVLEENHQIDQQKFRLRTFNDFAAIVDTDTDLFDVIGQLRLISGENLHSPTTTEAAPEVVGNRSKDRVFVHLLMKDGETIRIYLWDSIAAKFRERWNKRDNQPHVLLLTTVNPKSIGGAVTLSSTTSTRLFFDTDIAETKEFITWLGERSENIPLVTSSSSAITKLETVTLKEIHEFLQTEIPQVASFYCFATVIDVLEQHGWYYISCRYKTKLEEFETSLYCPKCKKISNIGLTRYRFEISVRDENNDVATFVLFDQDGNNIAGRTAKDFLKYPKEVPEIDGSQSMSTAMPDCLKSIIGRTCKFQIKLTTYNFGASRQTFSVSRIVEDNIDHQTKSSIETINVDSDEENSEPTVGMPTTTTHSKSSETVDFSGKKKDKRPRLDN